MRAPRRLTLMLCVLAALALVQSGRAQSAASPGDSASAAAAHADTLCALPCLATKRLLDMESHGFPTWLNQFPHHWMSRGFQYGQPRPLFVMGRPPWSQQIRWLDMEMNDPVYGVTALSVIPELGAAVIRPGFPLAGPEVTLGQAPVSGRPESRVYYLQGDNGLSHVDARFSKGRMASGLFEIGGSFLRTGGAFANSDVTSDRFRGRFSLPRGRMLLVYHFAAGRSDAGFPGAIAASDSVQFQRLRRKSRRSDHLLRIHLPGSPWLEKILQVTYHQDRLDYTDNVDAMINTEDKIRWGALSGLLIHRGDKGIISAGLHLLGAHASSLDPRAADGARGPEVSFSETPVAASLHLARPGGRQRVSLAVDFKVHDSRWQSHRILVGWQRDLVGGAAISAAGFHEVKAPPLGWRRGRLLPFENQAWPLLFRGTAADQATANRPAAAVVFRGGRLGLLWPGSGRVLYGDVFVQQVDGASYPRSTAAGETRFQRMGDFFSGGLFLRGRQEIGDLRFTATYQYHGIAGADSIAAGAVPAHRLWSRIALKRRFFRQNLVARFALMAEAMSSVQAFSADEFGGLRRFTRDALLLLHAQIVLAIGDAEIYLQWQNLAGTSQETPGFFWPVAAAFQFGVHWSFID